MRGVLRRLALAGAVLAGTIGIASSSARAQGFGFGGYGLGSGQALAGGYGGYGGGFAARATTTTATAGTTSSRTGIPPRHHSGRSPGTATGPTTCCPTSTRTRPTAATRGTAPAPSVGSRPAITTRPRTSICPGEWSDSWTPSTVHARAPSDAYALIVMGNSFRATPTDESVNDLDRVGSRAVQGKVEGWDLVKTSQVVVVSALFDRQAEILWVRSLSG
jgi:hypothetical protein